MKYAAHKDEYAARGWAHAQALAAGEKGLYPKGARFQKDGTVELPDHVAKKLRDKAQLRASKKEAIANRLQRRKPVKPVKPGPVKPGPVKPGKPDKSPIRQQPGKGRPKRINP